MPRPITPQEHEIFVAYEIYVEAALQYRAKVGAFRPRAELGATEALRSRMQYALKRLLLVAVTERSDNEVVLQLPALGRIGQTQVTDCPRYALLDGPYVAQVRGKERIELEHPELSLRQHRVQLDGNGEGLPPLFGNLLPFTLQF